jgi:alpha-amylase/alpha-mannosidase (GH57 family)
MQKEFLNILFLWHLHQPIYHTAEINHNNGQKKINHYILPWIRLHATKAYLDMAKMSLKFPEVGMVFNLTPSLLEQLLDYNSGNISDYYLDMSWKEPEDLAPEEKKFIIDKFFQSNWDTMIKPYPGYSRLLSLLEEKDPTVFRDKDIRDLQVWFNLTWSGFTAREEYPELKELIIKDQGFTQNDKKVLFDIQKQIISRIIPLFQEVKEKTASEISTTPFYHPILPLLIDTETAHRSLPQIPLPPKFSFPEDAQNHIRMAKELYKEIFNEEPMGFWPAEGSVSPEAVRLFIDEKVGWIATDEEILFNTLRNFDREKLFNHYKYNTTNGEIAIFFRDKGISDSIGFRFAKMSTNDALSEFFQNLETIKNNKKNKMVAIILDGENPWEYYSDGGKSFLEGLYSKLAKSSSFNAISFSKYLEKEKEAQSIDTIYSGSWIFGNYKIWIGSDEDNRAWEYLLHTRQTIQEEIEKKGDPEMIKKALEYIYAAEGSDWFWWYGDDFQSQSKSDFDNLFRSYLIAAWEVLDKEVPSWLFEPVLSKDRITDFEPTEFSYPRINGKVTSYYEWQGSILYKTDKAGSAMFNSQSIIESVAYGFNLENFLLKVEVYKKEHLSSKDLYLIVNWKTAKKKGILGMEAEESMETVLSFPIIPGEYHYPVAIIGSTDPKTFGKARIAIDEIIEIEVSFKDLKTSPDNFLEFGIELSRAEIVLEKHPRSNLWRIKVPSDEFLAVNWFV